LVHARLLVAPIGTAIPTLDGTVDPVVFVAAWKEVGYTDQGVQISYQAGIKDITVDEEMAPVKKILDTEKASISTVLAEATLTNLDNAIAAAILSKTAGDGTHARYGDVGCRLRYVDGEHDRVGRKEPSRQAAHRHRVSLRTGGQHLRWRSVAQRRR
jgi:hypothetical protein